MRSGELDRPEFKGLPKKADPPAPDGSEIRLLVEGVHGGLSLHVAGRAKLARDAAPNEGRALVHPAPTADLRDALGRAA